MSQKTYLAPTDQWDRTVALFLKHNEAYNFGRAFNVADAGANFGTGTWGLGWRRFDEQAREYIDKWDDYHLGRIVRPHHLFVPGDLVIITVGHGAMRRQTVWGVSSKGRPVRRLYVQCDTCYHTRETQRWISRCIPRAHRRAWIRGERELRGGWVAPYKDLINVDRGPLRFVDHPRELAGLPPDHAAVRRYAVETLCAGDAATRVSADSPHLLLQARKR